jgi:Holliday junction resolvase RusA-like endonuclease
MIQFFVPGEPRAKQSFRSTGGGHGYTPARIKAWQADVGWFALLKIREIEGFEPLTGDVDVKLIFYLDNRRRIDLDNLEKAVYDGLNKIVWLDDSQIVHKDVGKIAPSKTPGVAIEFGPASADLGMRD